MGGNSKENNPCAEKNEPELLRDGIHYTGNKGPVIGTRHVQVAVVSMTLGLAFAFRTSFAVAILAMTDNSTSSNTDVPTYEWNNKSIIISALFWGAICLPLFAGYIGKRFGPKWFLFGVTLIDSISFILIPLVARYCGSTGVIICRLIEGLAEGMLGPLNTCILGMWVPTEERSRMGFVGIIAMTLTIVTSSVTSGYISASNWGWPWIFYIFGGTGLVWTALVGLLIKTSPATHPRITPEEKKYIQVSLNHGSGQNIPTPWTKMFTSIHVWAILIAEIGSGWVMLILQAEMSIFMTKALKYSVKNFAVISAIPTLCGTFSGSVISFLSDYIPKRNILSVLNSRRMFHTIGVVGLSLSLLMMTFVPVKYATWAFVLLSLGNVFLVCIVVGGADINALDLSPKFAGIIFGTYSTISQAVALVGPLGVQLIVTDESDATQWRTIFIISLIIGTATATFFDIFASATRQSWDGENEKEAEITRSKRKYSLASVTGGVVGLSVSLLMMTFVPVKYATWAFVLLSLGNVCLLAIVVGGADINALDLSPRFAGIIFGSYNTISQAIALVAPLLVQLIVTDESDATQWRTIFIISLIIGIATAIFFDIFASATRQSWDGENEKEAEITRSKRKGSLASVTGGFIH